MCESSTIRPLHHANANSLSKMVGLGAQSELMISVMAKTVLLAFLVLAARVGGQSAMQEPKCAGIIHGVVYAISGQPAAGVRVTAYPLGIDLAVFLPTARADLKGEYRFEHLCHAKYTVIPDDPKAGYPFTSPYMNEFLYGVPAKSVRLNLFHPRAELPVYLPLKPGTVLLHLRDSETNSEILKFGVKFKVLEKRRLTHETIEINDNMNVFEFLVPPEKDVILLVNVEGYNELSKLFSVVSGTQAILNLNLERIN